LTVAARDRLSVSDHDSGGATAITVRGKRAANANRFTLVVGVSVHVGDGVAGIAAASVGGANSLGVAVVGRVRLGIRDREALLTVIGAGVTAGDCQAVVVGRGDCDGLG